MGDPDYDFYADFEVEEVEEVEEATPLPDVLTQLRAAKQTNRHFTEAWRAACKSALGLIKDVDERRAWKVALDATYEVWERAYLDAEDTDIHLRGLDLLAS